MNPNGWPIFRTIIRRNFDPEGLIPTSIVNGVLYSGAIVPFFWPAPDVIEFTVDPLADPGVAGKIWLFGQYYTGVTRDDDVERDQDVDDYGNWVSGQQH